MASEGIDPMGEGHSSGAWQRGMASAAGLLAAVLLIALVVFVGRSNRERDEALLSERRSYEVMLVTRGFDTALGRAEAALGLFAMTGDKRHGVLYSDQWRLASRQLTRLGQIAGDDPNQRAALRELARLYAQRGTELAPAAQRANIAQTLNAVSLYYEVGQTDTSDRIARTLNRISQHERMLLDQRGVAAAKKAARANMLATLLSGLGVVLAFGGVLLGWATFQAMAEGRLQRRRAIEEAQRAETLEQAVAERTRELSEANEKLREEVTERAAAEARLHQVQKMEAVGQLTGGIAHDFNNMLAVVVGGLDLARRRLDEQTGELARHIDNAMEGANRAAALTRRLLTFARAEPLQPEGIDPAALIAGMSDLIDRSLGERIHVDISAASPRWHVWCDPHQLENAVLNLAVNARDAMEEGGRLDIRTDNVVLADGEVGVAPAGEYVRIRVRDYGCGMQPEVLARVFEPFFTTKPVGKGTGLGLSQIFGFTRQSGGDIDIDSTPGLGTVVSLYLPRFVSVAASTAALPGPAEEPQVPAALLGATVLVVEDDARVRAATVAGLEELGYRPLPCESGEEALALLEERDDIRLIVSDVIMPGMSGPELIAQAVTLYPQVSVLFVTGYAGEAGENDSFAHYPVLRKPFTVAALGQAVTQAFAWAERGEKV